MKRPAGVTFIAVLNIVVGVAWFILFGVVSAGLVKELTKGHPWGVKFDAFLATWSLLWAAMFLAIGIGLWRLRRWARFLSMGLAALISVGFVVDFFRWTAEEGGDVMTQWESFEMLCRHILLLPYLLIAAPIGAGLYQLFPGSRSSVLTTLAVTTYSVGVLGYAGIARYMLTARAKQAFGRAS